MINVAATLSILKITCNFALDNSSNHMFDRALIVLLCSPIR